MEFSGSRVNKGKNKVGDQLSSKKLKSTAHLSCVPVGKSRGPRQGTTAAVSWDTARSFGTTGTYITTKWVVKLKKRPYDGAELGHFAASYTLGGEE